MGEKRIIIGLMGTIGSGKTYVSDYLIKKYKFYKISMGDLVREKADELGIERTRENLQKIGNDYRDRYGINYWIKQVLKRIKESDKERIIIDGIRTPVEARYFKKHSFLVFVDAKQSIRYRRIIERAREDDQNKTIDEIKEQEKKEFKLLETDKAYKYAEYKILNNSTRKDLEIKVDALLKKLLKN